MGVEAIAGIVVTVLIAVAGWVWRLSWRLATQEGRIASANTAATEAKAKVATMATDLAEHKEHVAAEYVSRSALKEITDAINRLGDRLDNLFIHLLDKP